MASGDHLPTMQPAYPSGMLDIETVRGGDDLQVRLTGELDRSFVDRVEEVISVAETTSARAIVVDLSDLEFIDSAGLSMLMTAHTRTRTDGQTLRFVPSSHDAVTQMVAVTGLDTIFN